MAVSKCARGTYDHIGMVAKDPGVLIWKLRRAKGFSHPDYLRCVKSNRHIFRQLRLCLDMEVIDWNNPPKSLEYIIDTYGFSLSNVEEYYVNMGMKYINEGCLNVNIRIEKSMI